MCVEFKQHSCDFFCTGAKRGTYLESEFLILVQKEKSNDGLENRDYG